jgi:hypothetical protein
MTLDDRTAPNVPRTLPSVANVSQRSMFPRRRQGERQQVRTTPPCTTSNTVSPRLTQSTNMDSTCKTAWRMDWQPRHRHEGPCHGDRETHPCKFIQNRAGTRPVRHDSNIILIQLSQPHHSSRLPTKPNSTHKRQTLLFATPSW